MKASRRVLLVLGIALALGAGLALLAPARRASGEPPPPPATPRAETPESPATTPAIAPAAVSSGAGAPAASASAAETEATPAAAAPLLQGEAAEREIDELSTTYDAAAVPALARYLAHPDAEIRAAARDGLVQLGERAAVPFLEAAAKAASAPEEARELREAAEFLALPSWTEHRRARKEAAAKAPPPSP